MRVTDARVGTRVADAHEPSRRGVVVQVLRQYLKVQWYEDGMPIVTYDSSQAKRLEKIR